MRLRIETELTTRAMKFAREAHGLQKRKYTNLPYWTHTEEVARIVATVCNDPEVIAAAALHDVIEDTPVTFEKIEKEFGHRVASLVREVTNVSKPEDGNRAARVALDRDHLACASADGMTIKLADLIDNTKSIAAYDPKFAVTYLKEKAELLDVLKVGNRVLWDIAHKQTVKERY